MHFEITSDRDVLLDAVGLLEAGKPVIVTEEQEKLFQAVHGVRLSDANFANHVSVTLNMDDEEV